MQPTYEELLNANSRWRSVYKDISIELSFHGYIPPKDREPSMFGYGEGTWCYYLILDQRMFYPKDWKKLFFTPKKTEYGLDYNYYRFPDVDFHGGITFYETDKHYDHKTGKYYSTVKAGCDYNHLWDSERGYPDSYNSVLFDAKRSARLLREKFPNVKMRCKYSGIWDVPDMFYEAKNGSMVHKSCQEKLVENKWDSWLPAA